MASISRFDCASSSLTLKDLLRKAQRILWICFGLGITVHISLMQISGFETEERVVKPLTTQFIKRQPRLTKPLELRKRPQPKRRRVQRQMVMVQARMTQRSKVSSIQPVQMLQNLARPKAPLVREVAFAQGDLEVSAVSSLIEGTREPKQLVDMSLEMVDPDAMDTGRYRAFVLQDPTDKRAIRGFLHMAIVIQVSHKDIERRYTITVQWIRDLIDAMNTYTDIRTDLQGFFTFDSPQVLETPWFLIATGGDPFKLSESERLNLAKYLTTGGFAFTEPAHAHDWGAYDGYIAELVSIKEMFQDALATAGYVQGRDWIFENLPNNHPIYHCYYDFDGPLSPAPGSATTSQLSYADAHDYVRGITIDGRMVAMIESGDYQRTLHMANIDGTRYRHFYINTIIFALTQEGSITHRVMDSVK